MSSLQITFVMYFILITGEIYGHLHLKPLKCMYVCIFAHTHYIYMVGWLCLTSDRQRGDLETAPPFTVPCEGREAR